MHTNYQRDFCKTYTEGGPQIELINFWCCFLHFGFFFFFFTIDFSGNTAQFLLKRKSVTVEAVLDDTGLSALVLDEARLN